MLTQKVTESWRYPGINRRLETLPGCFPILGRLPDARCFFTSKRSLSWGNSSFCVQMMNIMFQTSTCERSNKQDGRLTTAYFSHNQNCLNEILQMVKNKITVLNLVSKGFLHTSILSLNSILFLQKRGYYDFTSKNGCLTIPKILKRNPSAFEKNF